MNRRSNNLLLPILAILLFQKTPAADQSALLWQMGLDAARSAHTDSAFVYLKKALKENLSDDSLYYLWAEIYLNKGVPDTALALNLSIKPDTGNNLGEMVLEQRYLIYSMLGWNDKALALIDSTERTITLKQKTPFLPDLSLSLLGGGYFENTLLDKKYPYPQKTDSIETTKNGTLTGSFRATWKVLTVKEQTLSLGARLRYTGSRFSPMEKQEHAYDSADASAGAFIQYSTFSEQLATLYELNRKRDYLGDYVWAHHTTLRYMLVTSAFMAMFEGGWHYESPIDEQYFYLMAWYDRPVGKKHDLSFDLHFSGFSAKNLHSSETMPVFNVRNGLLFTDGLLSDTVLSLLESRKIVDDTVPLTKTIPRRFLSASSMFSYEYLFSKTISTGISAEYRFTWYRLKYSWTDLRYSSENDVPKPGVGMQGYSSFLARNHNDGNYYWIKEIPASFRDIVLESQPVVFHSQRRIDHGISLDVFFKRALGRFGNGIIDIMVTRNFSNLAKSAPVAIEEWYGEMTLSWFFRFKPGQTRQ